MMTKIIIAADSFKGSATSLEVADYLAEGIHAVDAQAEVVKVPVADGGEGTVASILTAVGGQRMTTDVTGPSGQPLRAHWGLLADHVAVLEVAEGAGITQVVGQLDPLKMTSYGVGQVIEAALDAGARTIYVGLGGSATTDGGVGLAQALGAHFYDAQGAEVAHQGAGVAQIVRVDCQQMDPRLAQAQIIGLTDVTNPLTGPEGAATVFGPQKGATPAVVQQLDAGLKNLNTLVLRQTGTDFSQQPGAGAAGGIGFGVLAFLGGQLQPGIQEILRLTQLSARLATADLVISGEGQIDGQSLMGKAPIGITKLAKAQGKPVVLIAGSLGADLAAVYAAGADLVLSSTVSPMSVTEAISQTPKLLKQAGMTAMRAFLLGHNPGNNGVEAKA